MTTDQIRQAYLDFFASKGHAVIPSAPLVPENDPTVLFTTAGMHPLVPYLLGETHPKGTRLTDFQRCVRTADIDEVGDNTHLTMFEMMGNWSLGDYFKKDAIAWSFEFLTTVLEIPVDMLAVTCFEGDKRFPDLPRDDESAEHWKAVGIPPERIAFMEGGVAESKKNWWGPAGQTGPCGPDTEMFYWVGKGEPTGNPKTHDAEWMEIWNDVFIQYNKQSDGRFVEMEKKNVDTGMGLERVAAVLQGVPSVYDTDRMKPIVDRVTTDRSTPERERHARIVTDHLKAATFMIADGVRPSNVDQGYVLRRLIRRAIRSLRQLGIHDQNACTAIVDEVIGQYGHVHAHIKARELEVVNAIEQEEAQFSKTLQEGLKQFTKTVEHISGSMIDGESVFRLYDTYGFPFELTKELAAEKGLSVDEDGFKRSFEAHQALSRAGAEQKFKGGLADNSAETTKLHTATHLLNAALHRVLGEHVAQKGSNITAERLRFDFTHADKMTPEQIAEVEALVNDAIKADLPVTFHLTDVEGAKAEGAIGVFDDRYGSEVKVYVMGKADAKTKGTGKVGDGDVFSKEICGGPHVARTGMLGSFKIQKEESSSAGVRRIKAVVSGGPAEIDVAGQAA